MSSLLTACACQGEVTTCDSFRMLEMLIFYFVYLSYCEYFSQNELFMKEVELDPISERQKLVL